MVYMEIVTGRFEHSLVTKVGNRLQSMASFYNRLTHFRNRKPKPTDFQLIVDHRPITTGYYKTNSPNIFQTKGDYVEKVLRFVL